MDVVESDSVKLAMVLYHYFPYGGLQRDFARIAREALRRGHEVVALVADWQGAPLEGVSVQRLSVSGSSNHRRMETFSKAVERVCSTTAFDAAIGFNRLQGLDVYFAADSCFAEHLNEKWGPLRRLPRYATYLRQENAVVAEGGPLMLFLNEDQRDQYRRHYTLPDSRIRILPPGIEPDRRRPANHTELRNQIRGELGIGEHESLLLFLGSGFKVKGLDRALAAFASTPMSCRLMIVGNDDAAPYMSRLQKHVRDRIQVLGPRDDVTALMQGADLLLHPAYRESAGMVLLEATVAGLPVLTTDTCGYARWVQEAGSGLVMPSPFNQVQLNKTLQNMLMSLPGEWQRNGLIYGENAALYQLPQTVVDYIEELAK